MLPAALPRCERRQSCRLFRDRQPASDPALPLQKWMPYPTGIPAAAQAALAPRRHRFRGIHTLLRHSTPKPPIPSRYGCRIAAAPQCRESHHCAPQASAPPLTSLRPAREWQACPASALQAYQRSRAVLGSVDIQHASQKAPIIWSVCKSLEAYTKSTVAHMASASLCEVLRHKTIMPYEMLHIAY